MSLTLNISDDAKEFLLRTWGEKLDRAALEALVIEGYRAGKYGNATVRRLIGLPDRWTTEKWLADHGVNLNYSLDDLDADFQAIEKLVGKNA